MNKQPLQICSLVKVTCEAIIVNQPRNRENSANGEAPLANAAKKISDLQRGAVWLPDSGPSRPGLAGSCDSRGVRLQDVLFPAYCTSQRRIREGRPDDSEHWWWLLFPAPSPSPLTPRNKIKTVRRDLSTLLLISVWTVEWNPCTQHWLYLPGCCLKCAWAQMENVKSCWSQHTELIPESNERITFTL